ncbi:MAG: hypothetical protein Q8R81_00870 [Novosphingobium sp.]|uniref:hypothetical protein n=1 Tax=Novosphingobium sp. TaxID=1874826 RepID=UPI0027362B10|nr:hypothetical protein [Novosphingobium sp.]MDP3548927.1 hypothetical protein [Novosphingobium sp.]
MAGAAGAAWLGWRNGLIDVQIGDSGVPQLVTSPIAPPSPSASAAEAVAVANRAQVDAQIDSASAKLAALEQRLAELNQQAIAASGNASHAEALLLAFAARRAVERGQPLGWIEAQLRARFGQTQGAAVDRVIAAGAMPVTISQLGEEFELLGTQLVGGTKDEGTWDWFSRQVSDIFVVRHDDSPSPAPELRLERTRAFLAGGKVEAAVAEIEKMPGRAAANDWIVHARDYMAAQRALDQLEAAALTGAQPVSAPATAPATLPIPEAAEAPASAPAPSEPEF